MELHRASAVIFDLDGTLLDTERATRGIMKDFLLRYGKVPDMEKEEKRLGQMHKDSAAAIVRDYELPLTPEEYTEAIMPLYRERWPQAKPVPGVVRLLRHLHKHGVPLGLASNSVRKHIETKISHQQGWKEYFSVVLGVDDVKNGKPSPDIFLEAAKRLGVDPTSCLIIEDSPVGVRAAKASGAKVLAVPSLQGQMECYSIADLILHSLLDFQPKLWGLPTFGDWVQNSLPIDPLHVSGLIEEGSSCNALSITTEDCSYDSIADQVSGVFIGWAKLEAHGFSKAVISTGWDLSLHTSKRITEVHLINSNYSVKKEKLQLLLVGYIRMLPDKVHKLQDNILDALKITEKDQSIARAALDLPIFSQHKNGNLFL
ncbi:Bifunctional riboflavin kinase/FMN phosphatase [Rhynchospora pubera]|uniref:riboflavin kinase n=1 Tax=Rhynchospora pubera TaxID=906938 RepID=A0AAV8ERZ6_9POAL|nr:Bifunctional riboflavin kinase/FMN phosphatase [Rhynchospora pubera]